MSAAKIVREYFAIYDERNREAAELVLAEDFTFSSPLDERIDRAEYFKRCWPDESGQHDRKIWKVFEDGDEVFITYECSRSDGSTFRNTEFFHVESDRIRHVEVFFGRDSRDAKSQLPLLKPEESPQS